MDPIDEKVTVVVPKPERYRPIAKLGSGGMADVFLGVQLGEQGFERLLVIKMVHAQGLKNDSAIQMFIDEARVIASLNHPHIVKVYDLSRVNDQICITMEYIDGENLEYMLRALKSAKKTFPLPIISKLMIEAAEALHYAHNVKAPDGKSLNLVHRDIGAQNLMIDSQGYLKVIDFGIAKSTVQTEFTLPGLIKGKLSYLPPDVFKFKDIDGRVDLYALGLVLYELVTMKRPFTFSSETSMPEIINSILQDSIPSPTEFNNSIPPELEAIIYKATEKNRDKRYQTGEDFARALYDFADKYEGIASTLEVRNWYQNEFRQRIEQRRKFEQLVQEKSDRIRKKTTNSGIIPLPSTLDSQEKPVASTEKQTAVRPVGPIIASKHPNLYLTLAVAFLLFIGGMVLIQQLFLKSAQVPIPYPPTDTKPNPSAISSVATPVAGDPSPERSATPAATQLVAKTEVATKSAPEVDRNAAVARIDKPTARRPTYQPSPRRRPTIQTNDADIENLDARSHSAESADNRSTSGPAGGVVAAVTQSKPAEKTASDSSAAIAEPLKTDDSGTTNDKSTAPNITKQDQKPVSNQPTNESKKPVAVATINLLSGNGSWTGEQVATHGCTYCHAMDWKKKTQNQWVRFISRGSHNQHRDLKLYFSDGELAKLTEYISSKKEEVRKSTGVAGGVTY
jgi:serine/threonine protein kinase